MDRQPVIQAQEGDRDAFVVLMDAVSDQLHGTDLLVADGVEPPGLSSSRARSA